MLLLLAACLASQAEPLPVLEDASAPLAAPTPSSETAAGIAPTEEPQPAPQPAAPAASVETTAPAAPSIVPAVKPAPLRPAPGSKYAQLVIPGLYQIQTRQPVKGWSIAAAELLFLAAGIALEAWSAADYNTYEYLPEGRPQEEYDQYYGRSETTRITGIAALCLVAGVYAYNWLDGLLFAPDG
ncbi:MAG: hypothetical protein V2A34_11335, partial [Lentisphaerota bacterium]